MENRSQNCTDDFGGNEYGKLERLRVTGLYMPQAITTLVFNNRTYLIAANEGNTQQWGKKSQTFINPSQFFRYFALKKRVLAHKTFGELTKTEVQQHLVQMKIVGHYDALQLGSDPLEAIYVIGGEPFSIWDATTLELVFDSARTPVSQLLTKLEGRLNHNPDCEVALIQNHWYVFFGLNKYRVTAKADQSSLQSGLPLEQSHKFIPLRKTVALWRKRVDEYKLDS